MTTHTRPVGAPAAALVLALAPASLAQPRYPTTPAIDHADEMHGEVVPDPYRWLEEPVKFAPDAEVGPAARADSRRVRDWVDAQNQTTFAYLSGLPHRDDIERRITELWNYERYSAPFRVADYTVFSKNDGLQNQSVLYIIKPGDDEPGVLIDPNTWTEDGTASLAGLNFAEDGRHVAFGRSDAGSDWRVWRIMDVETGELLPETLRWIKWGGLSWTHDGRGFFYARFPEPTEGQELYELNLNSKVYYHRLGTPQSADVLAFETPGHPEWGLSPQVTEDGRYLCLYASKGTDARNRLWVRDLADPYAAPVAIADDFEHMWRVVGNDGPLFYLYTDFEAPNRRVVRYDIRRGVLEADAEGGLVGAMGRPSAPPDAPTFTEIVPESTDPLRSVSFVGNMLVGTYFRDVLTRVRMFRPDGSHVRDVEFPGIGVAGGFGGDRDEVETYYTFSSIATPPTIYRYDLITGASEVFQRAEVDFDPSDYVVKQVFYSSKDGTRVPMFIAHKKGVRLNGDNPTLLYGYGGFNIPMLPYFSPSRLAWMEMGGVYAMPNLRGGGEYGKAWHKAGTKLQKQNVFDDFIAAAKFLIDEGYTRPAKLAIHGGSNGGLLVGAAMTQAPELFGAAIPAVGVMDMLRFHLRTAGRYWVDDYGSADDPEEFEALYAYSPYHQLLRQRRDGIDYPATLVTTADTDDRVVPWHSFKFAAALQAAHAGDQPVLIRVETRAGHGAGKPTSMRIEEFADMWAFLADNLDFEPAIGED